MLAALTDAEIAAICAPLTHGAAQVRYLRGCQPGYSRAGSSRPQQIRQRIERRRALLSQP